MLFANGLSSVETPYCDHNHLGPRRSHICGLPEISGAPAAMNRPRRQSGDSLEGIGGKYRADSGFKSLRPTRPASTSLKFRSLAAVLAAPAAGLARTNLPSNVRS